MALTLAKTWQLGYNGQSMRIPQQLIVDESGTEYFKLCATHYSTVKLLTGSAEKNLSIANSPGIRALRTARNIACGILVPVVPKGGVAAKAMQGACMPEQPGEPKLKRARFVRVPESCIVTCTIEGYGEVVMKRAMGLDDPILVPMNKDNILALFEAIRHVGLTIKKKDLGTTRTYTKSGRYVKSQPVEEGANEHDCEAEPDELEGEAYRDDEAEQAEQDDEAEENEEDEWSAIGLNKLGAQGLLAYIAG